MTLDTTNELIASTEPDVRLDAVSVVRRGRVVLDRIDATATRGELVAIAGASGAGKTTLLKVVAGLLPPTAGAVHLSATAAAHAVGYVPQDDIIPLDLSVEQVLVSAAALRLLLDAPGRQRRVEDVIGVLGLGQLRDTAVRLVSGGERKRVNVAVELLGAPDLFLLDEPTSGLDPASAATLLDHLRRLAATGTTVLMTTHAPSDIARSDRVVFLGRDGRIAYAGPPRSAPAHFGVDDIEGVYRVLERVRTRRAEAATPPGATRSERSRRPAASAPTSFGTQLRTLARRNASVLARSRLSLAILLGSPVLVTAMMLCLFPAGAASSGSTDAAQVAYWLTFGAFFFGLTDGLLQVVPEMAILRRDRVAGVRLDAYVVAKLVVLTPLLIASTSMMALTLLGFDRIPDLSAGAAFRLVGTLSLTAVAGLAVGLLASAAVVDTTQATLALPMICFPQVLFAGAVAPRATMALPARAMSEGLVTRWGFDGVKVLFGTASPEGSSLAAGNVSLAAIAVASLVGTVVVLRRRADPAR